MSPHPCRTDGRLAVLWCNVLLASCPTQVAPDGDPASAECCTCTFCTSTLSPSIDQVCHPGGITGSSHCLLLSHCSNSLLRLILRLCMPVKVSGPLAGRSPWGEPDTWGQGSCLGPIPPTVPRLAAGCLYLLRHLTGLVYKG